MYVSCHLFRALFLLKRKFYWCRQNEFEFNIFNCFGNRILFKPLGVSLLLGAIGALQKWVQFTLFLVIYDIFTSFAGFISLRISLYSHPHFLRILSRLNLPNKSYLISECIQLLLPLYPFLIDLVQLFYSFSSFYKNKFPFSVEITFYYITFYSNFRFLLTWCRVVWRWSCLSFLIVDSVAWWLLSFYGNHKSRANLIQWIKSF